MQNVVNKLRTYWSW